MIAHQFCELNHRSVWTDPIDAFMHRVFDFHGGPPSLEFECTRRNAASAPLPRTRLYNASSLLPGGSTVRTGDDLQLREGLSEIAAPAKNSDTELTAIKLGWTCQIVIEDRGTGELNKGLVRDSARRS